jgi:predicted HTH domain antitoxin
MLSIPDETLRAVPISEQELRQEVAALLYARGLALGKAAGVADMDRLAFRHFLASRRLPVGYDEPDLERDVRTLRELRGGGAP